MKNNKKEKFDIESIKIKSINDNISKCVNRYIRMKLKKNLRAFTGINVDRWKIFHIYKQKNVKI
tara:strand:- start:1568 stop:1759 length:192 start_codon:yes stop_codon:yes gene_type:complete